MNVALFVPCYVDQLHPEVAVATVQVLDALGVGVEFPPDQTCCGQPVANAGREDAGRAAEERYRQVFAGYEHVVTPSGSCAAHVRHHHNGTGPRELTVELVEFLHDEIGVDRLRALNLSMPTTMTAALHTGCHALRGLNLATPSELRAAPFDKVRSVLGTVTGLDVRLADREDECCGFGGTFAVAEPELSAKIGRDRLAGLLAAPPMGGGSEDGSTEPVSAIVSTDVSCSMHLAGLARRAQRSGGRAVRFLHVAEVLALALPVHPPAVP